MKAMNTDTPREESALQFPCDFPIKAMGLADRDLHVTVMEIVRRHAPDTEDAAMKSRDSSGGKYVSVTVTVRATSQAQLDAIYTELSAHDHVMMAL